MNARSRLFASFALSTLLASTAAAQHGVAWRTDLDRAKADAQATGRLVLVHFWAPWCRPCMAMEQTVFNDQRLGDTLETQYVPVKLNTDDHRDLAKKLGIKTLPADVVLAPSGEMLASFNSPRTAESYMARMSQVAAANRSSIGTVANAGTPAATVSHTQQPGQAPPTQPHANVASQVSHNGGNTAAAAPGGDRYTSHDRYSAPQNQPAPQGDRYGANAPSGDDRYAAGDRYASGPTYDPLAGAGQPTASQTPSNPYASALEKHSGQQPQPQQVAHQSMSSQPTHQPSMQPKNPTQPPAAKPAESQFVLDGFCPVTLVEAHRWAPGDKTWGAIHLGKTYLFVSQAEQQKFLADPDRYAPVMSGVDPVLALENRQQVPGMRKHGVKYRGQVYLFSSEETLRRFEQNPGSYANGVMQAMQNQGTMRK